MWVYGRLNDLYFYYYCSCLCYSCFYATIYNKFQEYIIRINEVESMIDTYLRNKYDLINKSIPIIKGNIKSEKEIFGEIVV